MIEFCLIVIIPILLFEFYFQVKNSMNNDMKILYKKKKRKTDFFLISHHDNDDDRNCERYFEIMWENVQVGEDVRRTKEHCIEVELQER